MIVNNIKYLKIHLFNNVNVAIHSVKACRS